MTDVSKLRFSVVDVTKIVTVVLCFCVQYYSLKSEIREAISSQNIGKEKFELLIAANTLRIDKLDTKYDNLMRSPADKPKVIKIESE